MAAKNRPVSKPMNKKFASGYDAIFGKGGPRPVENERNTELALVSDQALIDELNHRGCKVKWSRNVLPEPSNLGHKHWSPSAKVEEWDCRKELEK